MIRALSDRVWWLFKVRLRRGSGNRSLLTRVTGLCLCAAFIAAWIYYGTPWLLLQDVAAMKLQPISDIGFMAVAPNLAPSSGMFAGFAITIVVLLLSGMGMDWIRSAASYLSSEVFTRTSENSACLVILALKYIRDVSVSMLAIGFFAFTIAMLGYSIVDGRSDLASAAILYSLSSACFYLALLLFFGALVPLLHLSQLAMSVPVSRVLFVGAAILGGIIVLQSARTPVGTDYAMGIAFTISVALPLVGPLWVVNAFTGLRHRRRTMPAIGVWSSVTLVVLTAVAILVLPADFEADRLLGPVFWAQAAYVVSALSISMGIGWSMLLSSLDITAQPYDFPYVVVVAESLEAAGLPQAGIVVCAFFERTDNCDCERAEAVFKFADTRTIDDVNVAPYLAAYAAAFYARDYTNQSACIVLNNKNLAKILNDVVSEKSIRSETIRSMTIRQQLVLRGLVRISSAFKTGLVFSDHIKPCPRRDDAKRLASSQKTAKWP